MSRIKDLPYTLHTNRELGLMLAGKKPLAVFVDSPGHFPEVLLRYLRLFDRQVARGRLIRRDEVWPPTSIRLYPLQHVLFALPGEEWRIEAMLELKRSPVWSRDHERREGELLGYEPWMIDYHLARYET